MSELYKENQNSVVGNESGSDKVVGSDNPSVEAHTNSSSVSGGYDDKHLGPWMHAPTRGRKYTKKASADIGEKDGMNVAGKDKRSQDLGSWKIKR